MSRNQHGELFTATTLTDAINALPTVPGKAGALGIFEEKGVRTTTVLIEHHEGRLALVPTASRTDNPTPVSRSKRARRPFEIPHLPQSGVLLPADVQDLVEFGSQTNPVSSVATVVNDELERLKANIDATKEWHRVGALRGRILDADASVIYDLHEEFGITPPEQEVALGASGDPRKSLLDGKRQIERAATGIVITGWRAFVGPDFFDRLTGHKEVKAAYANWQAAQDRLGGDLRTGFTYAGIVFEEYIARVSGQDYIPTAGGVLFPIARGMFKVYNAPANYNEAVNTLGKPYYAKSKERDMGKGYDLEAQANPLTINLVPGATVDLSIGT
ncbi:major capsid protein [Castellaniella hirudinis]|uniref:major capsid protein n=1 Tax=Castellaniella hirudinis TaxID=1144617 RepID=UPI0039C47EB5